MSKRTGALICGVTLILVACGYKGPLYLPNKTTSTPTTSPNQFAPQPQVAAESAISPSKQHP